MLTEALAKCIRFYLKHEGLIFLGIVSLFVGIHAPVGEGSRHPFADGVLSALIYGACTYFIFSFLLIFPKIAAEEGLLVNWRMYVRVIVVLLAIIYGSAFMDAQKNPWTLWKRRWSQFYDVEMISKGRYTTREACINAQWKSRKEELSMLKQAKNVLDKIANKYPTVYITEGRTIFEFGKSFYSRSPEEKDKLVADTSKRTDLTDYQKRQLISDLLRPEIVSTTSIFCAPTSKNALWPFNTPNYYAPGEALTDLGERMLAARASKILGE